MSIDGGTEKKKEFHPVVQMNELALYLSFKITMINEGKRCRRVYTA